MKLKPLVLSYELAWRTKADDSFMKSKTWREVIRPRILRRDNHTCRYCGYRAEKSMHLNHIDGDPKNNDDGNLEVICRMCHMIAHSGLFSAVLGIIEVYETSKYSQNEIIQIARKMRGEGKSDEEIKRFLGLKRQVPWKQNLKYLTNLYGFISSEKPRRSPKPLLTEAEQKQALRNRDKW